MRRAETSQDVRQYMYIAIRKVSKILCVRDIPSWLAVKNDYLMADLGISRFSLCRSLLFHPKGSINSAREYLVSRLILF